MDFSEIIGFIISLAALFYLLFKRSPSSHEHNQTVTEKLAKEEEYNQKEQLKRFLRSLDDEEEEEDDYVEIVTPKPTFKPQNTPVIPPIYTKPISPLKKEVILEEKTKLPKKTNLIPKKIGKEWIIAKEVLDKPLALRNHDNTR